MSFLTVILFLGGWLPPLTTILFTLIPPTVWLSIKALVLIFAFVWIRAAFPRFRYDQLMALTWRTFLPLSAAVAVFAMGLSLNF
jgi:NADH-quinone oxidoreductase subunit H